MKLNFLFKTSSLDIKEEKEYTLDNSKIIFNHNDELYTFDKEKNRIIKDNKESLITIEIDNKIINVYSKEIKRGVEIPINVIFFDNRENYFELQYNLVDDDTINNIIKIEY